MSNDTRKQWEIATDLTQDFLDASQDNLVNKLELVVDIEKPDGSFIRASDRNKYIGGTFYEALLDFPVIRRTVGEYLSNQLEFSDLELELSNVDKRFNPDLPGGDDFDGWIGNSVTVRLGIDDELSTYRTIFDGFITEEGGFKRTVNSIVITARDKFDKLNKNFPSQVFTSTAYPNLEEDKENLVVPIIYGDWTTEVEPRMASIEAIVVNGADTSVNGEVDFSNNIELVIANHPLVSFDTTRVYLRRGEKVWLVDPSDVTGVSIGTTPSFFEIVQESADLIAQTPDTDNQPLQFGSGDQFFVLVKGKDLGSYDDNIISQARDILETYAGAVAGDFATNWSTVRDKASPAVSAISSIKSRVWIQEPQNAMEYVLSLLEQVRVEVFADRDLKLRLLPLHFDEFEPAPDFNLENFDVVKDSFRPRIDERTNFNRAKGVFNFLPNRNENFRETAIYVNQPAVTQANKTISKKIVYPNLYVASDVENQVQETLKLASSYLENIDLELTPRSMLLDIGDFVKINVKIQSTEFTDVPALIREVGYDPSSKVPMRIWSFQMVPFPGYRDGGNEYPGTVGGSTATITEE